MSAHEFEGLLSIDNPTIERPNPKSFYWEEPRTTIVSKGETTKNPLKAAAKAALPTVHVVLAGPVVSCFPFGSLAPILSILATSLASTYSDRRALGIAIVLIQGCGLCGFEGRMIALLSFLSFSSTFDKLQVSSKGFSSDFETVRLRSAGALLSACSTLLGILQIITFAVRGAYVNAFMLPSRSFEISWNKKPSLGILTSHLDLLAQTPDDSYSMGGEVEYDGDSCNPIQDTPTDVSHEIDSRYPAMNKIHEASPEDLLEDWETVKEALRGSCLDGMECRIQALINEVNRLIDDCDGISAGEWREIIAALD